MPQIITFLGKGGSGRTTMSIAAARQMANGGQRVLWVGQSAYYAPSFWSDAVLSAQPQSVAANLSVVNLSATQLLEKAWDVIKQAETKYLRTPLLQNVYGQELSVVSGIDGAVALYSLQEYFVSGKYDVIIYDNPSSLDALRAFAMPDTLSWYIRRFRQVIETSDLWRNAMPILQPVAATVLSMAWTGENLNMPAVQEATEMLDRGQKALADPTQVAAYLVVSEDPAEIQAATWMWGSAQQASLAVAGVLVNRASAVSADLQTAFAPLPVVAVADPRNEMPSLKPTRDVPKPIEVDVTARQVRLFLPGFTKQQVKLSQSGPEITIEAGEQRRNILLPPGLRGADVTGAKFQDNYLIISL
jgi:anion-transporting  ArsA/GET3 family ATPase